jgi:hypothetical protein
MVVGRAIQTDDVDSDVANSRTFTYYFAFGTPCLRNTPSIIDTVLQMQFLLVIYG